MRSKSSIKTFLKFLKNKIADFSKKNKLEFTILLLIIFTALFVRIYRISEYMTFLGDEGRDAIIVRNLIVNFDPILIGPGTSIGNMYLGPLYYYLIAPALAFSFFHPVGPALLVSILGVFTVFLLWFVLRDWFYENEKSNFWDFGKILILLITFLYSISPVVIIYSRSSWNPNIMPFFSLLFVYSVWKFWHEDKYKWLLVSGISSAFILQSHYLGLSIVPLAIVFWGIKFFNLKKKKDLGRKNFLRYSVYSLLIFSILMSPILIFDLRNEFINFKAMKVFFTQRQTTVSARPWSALPKLYPLLKQYVTRIMAGTNSKFGVYLSEIIVFGIFFVMIKWRSLTKKTKSVYLLLSSWLIFSFVGYGVYKQHIYDHYFGQIFALGYLLLAGFFFTLFKCYKKLTIIVCIILFSTMAYFNLLEIPLKYAPNRQFQKAEIVAEKIIEMSQGKPFNFALISDNNYEDGYTYLFDLKKADYRTIIPDKPQSITDQLFVVCEIDEKECNPETNTRPELAWFGWRKIEIKAKVSGIILYKLVHK